jgi:hypothetical protein
VAAAEDPQLARRLRGAGRFRPIIHVPRIPVRAPSSWWAAPLVLVGLALVVASLSTTVVLGVVGAVITASGLRLAAGAIERRWMGDRSPD